jgi:hypothetical protein
MADGSRPLSRPYEGQRVNPVPEGFLAAYANVGKTYADAGETLGKGIGTAVAAYIESKKKSEASTASFRSLAPRLKPTLDSLDKKLAGASEDIKTKALDESNTEDEVVLYRALSKARADLVGGIPKFEDMSNSKKEQWLGAAVNLIKFAEDDEQKTYTRGREKTQDEAAKAAAEAARLKEQRLAGIAADKALREAAPAGLASAFSEAVRRGKVEARDFAKNRDELRGRISRLRVQEKEEVDPERKARIKTVIDQLVKVDETSIEQERRDIAKIQEITAAQTIKDANSAGTLLAILKEQRASLLGGVPELLKRFEDGTAVSVDPKTGAMTGFTVGDKAIDAVPAPIRKELQYLQADIMALEKTLGEEAKRPQKDKDGNPIKRDFVFVPPSANMRADGMVRRQRAQAVYSSESAMFGYTPSQNELDWVADLAEYDGAVTDDGMLISIDPKTGRIEAKRDQQWVEFNNKNPLLWSQTDIQAHQKRQAELNQIAYASDRRTFGSKTPNGEQKARRWVFDSTFGNNSVFIRGQANAPDAKVEELHKAINYTNNEMASLSSIIRTIAKKDESGAVVYKVHPTGHPDAGKPVLVRGQPVPEVESLDKLGDPEKKSLAIGIANFIRIRAEKLGVLSAQDWAYLDTLIPQISAQFKENITAGQSVTSLMPKILDYVITNYSRTSESIISNAITLQADSRAGLITSFKNIPATGTASGVLEVTGGLARLETGEEMRGDSLARWYDINLTSDYDTLNESNDLADGHARLKIAYETRRASTEAMNKFKEARSVYRAFLKSRGMTDEQCNEIFKRYFASE